MDVPGMKPTETPGIFASFFDEDLIWRNVASPKKEIENLRDAVNRYCLFNRELYVFDVCLLYNAAFRELIRHGYGDLLGHRIIQPVLRDQHLGEATDSFATLERLLRTSGTYGHPNPTLAGDYARHLDDLISPKKVRTSYEVCSSLIADGYRKTLLDPGWSDRNGLTAVASELRTFVDEWARHHPEQELRRSPFFTFSDKLKNKRTATLIRRYASVVWNSALSRTLDHVPAFPESLRDDLRRFDPNAPLECDFDSIGLASLVEVDRNRLAACDFSALEPKEILDLRRRGGNRYFGKLAALLDDPTSPEKRIQFTKAAHDYYDLIYETLGAAELPGKRRAVTSAQRFHHCMQAVELGGGLAITLISVRISDPSVAVAGGIAWLVAAAGLGSIDRHQSDQVQREIALHHADIHGNVNKVLSLHGRSATRQR